LEQADTPPKQVVVEAHVLQVSLQDDLRHGVEFDHMLRLAGSEVSLESTGLTSEQGPTTMLRLQGSDLDGLIEAIKTNTDAKTLASPKVAVLNGQQARMQVGGQIGYLLTTTTQTSTLESVDFLDIGVILSVTPLITEDQQVLLDVRPQVSTGRINPNTNLPESETTEIETKVMLGDGEALVIGGLIQETDNLSETKIPWLGDLKGVGRFFQKREVHRERSEIIIALVPRILHPVPGCRAHDLDELQRATTPLMHGPLHPNNRRRWEPRLPSAKL
jgi:type II secretory pathway component GspD/PulD (secretin)